MVGAIESPHSRPSGARKNIVFARFAPEKTSFSPVLRAKNLVCARLALEKTSRGAKP
jgi:hypothetical protein